MSELKPLPELLSAERETEVPFFAFLGDKPITVTAVLERTVVWHHLNQPKEKFLASHIKIRARPQDVAHGHYKPTPWHGRPVKEAT